MTGNRPPWTAGELAAELAKYPPGTPLRVAVSDLDHPDESADWGNVVLGCGRGQEKRHGNGDSTATPFLLIESYPLSCVEEGPDA